MSDHTVKQGDCLLSIAAAYGFDWRKIWDHPDNSNLKEQRDNPNVLLPGDVVHIPEKQIKEVSRETDKRHRFVKKGIPAKVRLRLLNYKRQPRSGIPYTVVLDDGKPIKGSTDGDGYITFSVPPNATQIELTVLDGAGAEQYTLPLGHIDPIDSTTGIQQRLINLGYPCDSEMGTIGDATRTAIRAFQKEMGMKMNGEINDIRDRLKQMHGC